MLVYQRVCQAKSVSVIQGLIRYIYTYIYKYIYIYICYPTVELDMSSNLAAHKSAVSQLYGIVGCLNLQFQPSQIS